jgi:hypothetical protein
MKYTLKRPCAECPFRKAGGVKVTRGRAVEIANSLDRAEFPCHKTVDHSVNTEGDVGPDSEHCAGALLMLEAEGAPSQMMRICERLGIYDRNALDQASSAEVFASRQEFIRSSKARTR